MSPHFSTYLLRPVLGQGLKLSFGANLSFGSSVCGELRAKLAGRVLGQTGQTSFGLNFLGELWAAWRVLGPNWVLGQTAAASFGVKLTRRVWGQTAAASFGAKLPRRVLGQTAAASFGAKQARRVLGQNCRGEFWAKLPRRDRRDLANAAADVSHAATIMAKLPRRSTKCSV